MEVSGVVFDVKKFAIHDGPGIRTTVFLKGCPLRCTWCHNPESQAAEPELAHFPRNCIGCLKCLANCPHGALSRGETQIIIDRAKCRACGACARECYAEALVMHGRVMTVSEVLADVEKDRPFYENSGGGMTLSGGEPLAQADFAAALLKAAHEAGIHTLLDTCGHAPWEAFERVLPWTDMVFFDLKQADPERHRRSTGVSNDLILENLRRLTDRGVRLHVRVPVVPGHNATAQDMEAITALLSTLRNVPPVELLRYHRLGEGKYESLGLVCPEVIEHPPADELMQDLCASVTNRGVECCVGS